MTYKKDSIYHTGLPIMVIDEKKLFHKYPQIGYGEEGSIHQYDQKKAIKVFEFFEEREKLNRKFEKLEELARVKDKSFCFPQGLVGYLDLKKEGYFMELVNPSRDCKDFSQLYLLKNVKKTIEYLIAADRAMQRIHRRGIVIGDIRDENIMINEKGEVKFIDTDNYRYGDYDYDLVPSRSKWLANAYPYSYETSDIDNDIFVFTMMALQKFMPVYYRGHKSIDYFYELVDLLDVSNEVKEGLRLILSDAPNKPYVHKVLKKINPGKKILSQEAIIKLSHKY